MHGEGVADELRQHCARARPRLDHALLVARVHRLDALRERFLNERTLFYAATHDGISRAGARCEVLGAGDFPAPASATLLSSLSAFAAADDEFLRRLLLVARLDAFLFAPRAHDIASAARAAAVGVIHRIHDLAANARPTALPPRLPRLAPREQLML